MALTGSISRNSITPSGPSFQVDLNIEAQVTPPTGAITEYEFIRNGVVENTVTITPTNNYSNIITYIEHVVGTHVYEVKFKTIGSAVLNDTITLTFDHDIPTVNSFNLIDIDGGGSVEYDEFIVTCINYKLLLKPKSLETFFKLIGPDDLGYVTAKQIVIRLEKYS